MTGHAESAGSNLGADIGTLANPSGLVSAHTTRLDSFWVQQAFFKNRVFVRVGQLGGLDFFGNQEYGPAYVIEPLDYALGNLASTTHESFDPAATPAVLIEVVPWRTLYVKSAVLAGNRNPYKQDPNGLHFAIRDTPVFVNEIGFTRDTEDLSEQRTQFDRKRYPGTYKLDAAYNGGKCADAAGTARSRNYLIYGTANQALFRSEAGSSRGLDATLAFDWSPNNVNRENSQITAGVRYNGAIPRRPRDTIAFGFVHIKIGDPFHSIDIPLRAPMLGSEKAIELNYAAYLKPYLMCQPVFQYYSGVGGNSRVPDAAVMGFRVIIDF